MLISAPSLNRGPEAPVAPTPSYCALPAKVSAMKDKTDILVNEIEAFDLLSLPLRKNAKAEGSKNGDKTTRQGKGKTAAPKAKSK